MQLETMENYLKLFEFFSKNCFIKRKILGQLNLLF